MSRKQVWETHSNAKISSPFKPGDRFVIVSEAGLFPAEEHIKGMPAYVAAEQLTDEIKKYLDRFLSMTEITVTDRKIVKGDYRPQDEHYGYRAMGSDGAVYECQWDHFDDCSNQPYCNWRNKTPLGLHYLNWTVQSHMRMMRNPNFHAYLLKTIAERWPVSELVFCDKKGINVEGREYGHSDSVRNKVAMLNFKAMIDEEMGDETPQAETECSAAPTDGGLGADEAGAEQAP